MMAVDAAVSDLAAITGASTVADLDAQISAITAIQAGQRTQAQKDMLVLLRIVKAQNAQIVSLSRAVLADPEIAKVADIEAIRTAAEGTKDDDALVLAVAKVLGADPAEVRKKRDENPQWFADMVTSTGSAT